MSRLPVLLSIAVALHTNILANTLTFGAMGENDELGELCSFTAQTDDTAKKPFGKTVSLSRFYLRPVGTGTIVIRKIQIIRGDSVLFALDKFFPDATWSIDRADDGSSFQASLTGLAPLTLTYTPNKQGENPNFIVKKIGKTIEVVETDEVKISFGEVSRIMNRLPAAAPGTRSGAVIIPLDLRGRFAREPHSAFLWVGGRIEQTSIHRLGGR